MDIIKYTAPNGFAVNLEAYNFDSDDLHILRQSVKIMAHAMDSEEFKDFCLNYQYEVTTCTGAWWWKNCNTEIQKGFRWNKGKTQLEIYNHLMTGSEVLSPEVDREADIYQVLDKSRSWRAIGYTYPNTKKQWIYNRFFASATPQDIAGNLAHEWCHKMDYNHEYRYSYLRAKTVPYAVGNFVGNYQLEI